MKPRFRLTLEWSVDCPFFFSCVESREKDDVFMYNEQTARIREFKNRLYDRWPQIEQFSIFIIDKEYTVEVIKSSWIEEQAKELGFEFEMEDDVVMKTAIRDHAQAKTISDQQMQILIAFMREFNIYKWGLLTKKLLTKPKVIDTGGWKDVVNTNIQNLYNSSFREYIVGVKNYKKEEVDDVLLAKEFKTFVNYDLPTPYVSLLLRQHMQSLDWVTYNPLYRQKYFHYNMDRFNFIATWRQSGKTFDSCALAITLTFIEWRNDVIYVCKNEKVFSQPREYFESFGKSSKKYKIINITKTDHVIKNNITGNSIRFVSAGSDMGARSFSAKHIIFDEASYIKDAIWNDALPIILRNWSNVYAFSTINREQKKEATEWFYKWLVEIELWLVDGGFALRVTIDDIEIGSQKDKVMLKKQLWTNQDRYYAELYATIPPTSDWIISQGFFIPKAKTKEWEASFLIGYDPAKKSDTGGVIIIDMKTGTFMYEYRFQNVMYSDQKKFLKKLKEKYLCKLAMDVTGVGEAVYEIMKEIVDYQVQYTGGISEDRFRYQGSMRYKVGKIALVDNFTTMSEDQKIFSLLSLTKFQWELEMFKEKKTPSWVRKYEAINGTDDIVNAWLIAAYIYKKTYIDPLMKQLRKRQRLKDMKYKKPYAYSRRNDRMKRMGKYGY